MKKKSPPPRDDYFASGFRFANEADVVAKLERWVHSFTRSPDDCDKWREYPFLYDYNSACFRVFPKVPGAWDLLPLSGRAFPDIAALQNGLHPKDSELLPRMFEVGQKFWQSEEEKEARKWKSNFFVRLSSDVAGLLGLKIEMLPLATDAEGKLWLSVGKVAISRKQNLLFPHFRHTESEKAALVLPDSTLFFLTKAQLEMLLFLRMGVSFTKMSEVMEYNRKTLAQMRQSLYESTGTDNPSALLLFAFGKV